MGESLFDIMKAIDITKIDWEETMKKVILLISTALILVLAGCTEGEIKRTADRFFNDGNLDLTDKAHVVMPLAMEIETKENMVVKNMMESLGIEDPQSKFEDIEGYKELMENIRKLKSNTEYEIKSVKLNDTKTEAEIVTDIHYVSIGELLVRDMGEVMDRNVLKVFSGEKVDEEEFLTMLFQTMNDTLESLTVNEESLSIKKNATIKLVKNSNEWKISEVDENMLNALLLDFPKESQNSLNKKIEEVNSNRLFLEIEFNLRDSFDVIFNMIKDGEVKYESLLESDKLIVDEIKDKLNVNAKVVEKVGKDEGIYYITKGPNENEVTVTVINEEEKFTFADKVK